ncbi:MAG: ribose 5-phosphate isomerase A [Gammaproteobacteria bacterium]|nr:MAG: ribose 5-phosphate isomerase A [Gammaproteobacteria bacterium]
MPDQFNDKQIVAQYAADLVENGMTVGLGTGSTANYFIEALAKRKQQGLEVTTVSSSIVSMVKAQSLDLNVISIEQLQSLDLYVDGADEVTDELYLLKGRGSDLVREKLLATASKQMIVMVDKTKLVDRIGEKFAIPIEVMPFSWQLAKQNIELLGGSGELRANASGDGLAVTSHGSLVLDMQFDVDTDITALDKQLSSVPGVVEHGIFIGLASTVLIAEQGKVEVRSNK